MNLQFEDLIEFNSNKKAISLEIQIHNIKNILI